VEAFGDHVEDASVFEVILQGCSLKAVRRAALRGSLLESLKWRGQTDFFYGPGLCRSGSSRFGPGRGRQNGDWL